MTAMKLDFAWLGQGLAIDLVNTYVPAQDADLLDRWPELDRWPSTSKADLERLRADATTVVDLLITGSSLPKDLRERLNGASRDHPDEVTLAPDRTRAVYMPLEGTVARHLIGLVAEGVTMRRCPAPGCGMAYPRTRSNQRWCSASCGNRARVARHAERRRVESSQITS